MQGSAVQEYYRRQASIYDATRWLFLIGRGQAVDQLQLRANSDVLELGCGTGRNFGLVLCKLASDEGTLIGLDFSKPMLEQASRRIVRRGWPNVRLVEGDASDFDLHRQFDAVFICYALSMMPGWRETICLAHGHLRQGGRLVVHDFDRFDRWGPIGTAIRGWQRRNHVDTDRPIEQVIGATFGNVDIARRLGGYHYTAVAIKR